MRNTLVFAFLILLSQEIFAMSFLKPGKTCVFSEVKALLTLNGEPVKNATIIRRWEWKDLREEQTKTDEHGYFEFPAVFESSVSRLLPVELVIAQGLYAVIDNEEVDLWVNSKRRPEENSELQGQPISLTCELNNEMQSYENYGSALHTLCKWDQ